MSRHMMRGAAVALAGMVAGAAWGGGQPREQRLEPAKIEVIRLNELGSEGQPHVLDMARESDIKISTHQSGEAHVRVINMLPSRLSSYVLEFEKTRISIPAFDDPRKGTQQAPLERFQADEAACKSLKEAIDKLLAATDEATVPDLLNGLADASRAVSSAAAKKGKYSTPAAGDNGASAGGKSELEVATANEKDAKAREEAANAKIAVAQTVEAKEQAKKEAEIARDDQAKARKEAAEAKAREEAQKECAENLEAASKLAASTSKQYVFKVTRGNEITLRMRRGDLKREMVLRSEPRQWLTHVGFTFMENKDERYYSREIASAPGTYEVARQENEQRNKYAATVLFTYPVSDDLSGLNLGFTAGLGASAETVSVMAGISLIIGENVLITGGVAVQEFDVLNGVYREGHALGSTPVDSSVLMGKTYKASFMMTLGLRFGSQ